MRIAHLITRMILGGAQENTLLTCEDLMRIYGDEVLLVTGPPLGPEGSLLDRAQKNSVPLAMVDSLRRSIHPWRDAASYVRLKHILRDFRPDVVHTHSAKGGFLGRMAATAVGVPAVVHTVHGAPFHEYQGRGPRTFFRLCERFAARRCHALISVADAMTERLVAARVAPREMFTTIYSGMEIEPYLTANAVRQAAREQLGYAPRHLVIGKIARLFHLKGHEYVIQAARQVVRETPDARFLFVGDGILKNRLQQQIADAGLTGQFQFAGLVSPERIPELVAAMDVVVHASLREGLARALVQGLIAEKPVVSYDIDGAREVVIPDVTGFLLPPCSVEPIADALARLARDAALRERLGKEGRRRFADQFRHQHSTQRIRQVYEQVLTGQGGVLVTL